MMTLVQRNLPSGTVTFLFTDVEGSTKLLHERGAAEYANALAEHRRILRGAFSAQGGVEVDTQGDAFFVAFPTAAGALEAARAITEGLKGGPIRVRIGIHTGTPHLSEEGYVGEDVHKGARIAAAAHGGQVLLSKETRELAGVDVTDLGEHRLKDFERPVWIFQLGSARLASALTARAPAATAIGTMPVSSTMESAAMIQASMTHTATGTSQCGRARSITSQTTSSATAVPV